MTDSPSPMVAATSFAMARLASACSRMRRSNGASPTIDGRPMAPCIFSTEPSLVSGFTSRRTVSSETPSFSARRAMVIVPSS